MILNKVVLENWAIFRETTEFEFSDGLNIIHGPNEAGKSTLIDSIRIVLFTKHTSRSEKIKSLIPWGSDLPPKATITFFKNDAYYRISKRFISSERSLLEKLIDGKWVRIAEGDSSDKKVIELVSGKLPSKGDTRPEFWGIGQTLWMVQGEPFISENLNEETLSSLQKLIGTAIETEEEKDMFKRVEEKFLSIFTTARREFKKGSEIKELDEKIGELKENKKSIDELRRQKEELLRSMEEKEIMIEKKEEKLEISLDEKEKLEKEVEKADEHEKVRRKLEEEVKEIFFEYERLKTTIDDIKEGERRIKSIEAKNFALNEEKNEYQIRLTELKEKIEKISEQIYKLNEDIESKEDAYRYARITYETIQKEKEIKEKETRLNRLEELEREFKTIKVPSEKELNQIEQTYQKIRDLKTKLASIGLKIKIRAESDISGRLQLDEKTTEFKLKPEEQKSWKSHQIMKVQIDNIGEFEIRSGSEDIKKTKLQLNKLEIEYEKALSPYNIKDIEKLRKLLHHKEELKKRLNDELREFPKSGGGIKKEIVRLKKEVELNWNRIPENSEFKKYKNYKDKTVAYQELSKKLYELESELKNLNNMKKGFEKEHSILDNEREKIKNKVQKLEKMIQGNQCRMEEIRINLEKLKKNGISLKEREKLLSEQSLELREKQIVLKKYINEIKEVEERPRKALEECITKIGRLKDDISKLRENIAEMNGKLSTILKELKDTSKIEEELEYLNERKERLLIDARAIELLYDLFCFYRRKTIESLTEPIKKLMVKDMKRLFGERYASIKFNEGVKPESVEVSDWGIDAPIDVLSFGTKEQIWYLFRLALGRLLSDKEKQLVVLDDPLANTDPVRMYHALQILRESANKLQIIVITCDVDKYNWLPDAKFIPLER